MTPFEFHTGIEYEQHGDQWIGPCPFCEKEDKFYFNKENMWDCKNASCLDPITRKQRSGNLVIFLRQLYEEHETIAQGAKIVADWRGLPIGRISQLGIKYNPWNDSIIIPTFRNGKINNLYKATKENVKNKETDEWEEKLVIRSSMGMEHTLMNYPEDPAPTVWVCEGHWDRIAAEAIIGAREITAIGVPGAGVWKKGWTDVLVDRDVVFCYDSDNAGRVGFEKVILKHIASHPQKPRSISFIDWPEEVPDGYDLNDTYNDHGRKAYEHLQSLIKEFNVPEGTVIVKNTIESVQADKSVDSFEKLTSIFKETYYTTEDMELCLLLVLTSVYSINIGGEQIWLRIIGPPGCGKTTICKAVSASDCVVLRSTFTGLFSGWKDDKGQDASMVPLIAGKTLVVKDADALLRQPNVERIFSELRDFYDKDSSTQYKNMVHHDYRNIPCTMVLCGTNVLRRSDQSFLGERFLDYEMTVTQDDLDNISMKMLQKSMELAADPSNLPPEMRVQAATKGFVEHMMERRMTTKLSESMQHQIMRFSKLAAKMRTKVDRDTFGKGDITFAPVSELPTRLIGQLTKLSMCVPVVTGDTTEHRTERLLKRVVRHIINPSSNRYRICEDLMEGWFDRDTLMEKHNLSKSQMNREIDDLRALDLVEMRKGATTIARHSRMFFTLKNDIKEGLISLSKI